jgi:hypothetical protein
VIPDAAPNPTALSHDVGATNIGGARRAIAPRDAEAVNDKASEDLHRVVLGMFGFLLVGQVGRFALAGPNLDAWLHPPHGLRQLPGALALLLVVLVTTIPSLIAWVITMRRRPYRLATAEHHWMLITEGVRFAVDMAIVALYSCMVFWAAVLLAHPDGDLRVLLGSYVVMTALYAVWGGLRRLAYRDEPHLDRPRLEVALMVIYAVTFGTAWRFGWATDKSAWVNVGLLLWLLVVTVAFRVAIGRRHAVRERRVRAMSSAAPVAVNTATTSTGTVADSSIVSAVPGGFDESEATSDELMQAMSGGTSDVDLRLGAPASVPE